MDESLVDDRSVTDADRAFALWCAQVGLAEDETAPHGLAFYAGYAAARYDALFTDGERD